MKVTITKVIERSEWGMRVQFKADTHEFDTAEASIDWDGFGIDPNDAPRVEAGQGSIGRCPTWKARLRAQLLIRAADEADALLERVDELRAIEVTKDNHRIEEWVETVEIPNA